MEDETPALADGTRWIEAVVLVRGHLVLLRHGASPVVVRPDSIGIGGSEVSSEVAAHEIPAVVRATEAGQRAVPQGDRLQLGKECLAHRAQILDILLRQDLAVASPRVG